MRQYAHFARTHIPSKESISLLYSARNSTRNADRSVSARSSLPLLVAPSVHTHWTQPPRHLSEAGLLSLMEEHGIGTEDDKQRAWFIRESLRNLQHTIEGGVPVKGYIHWTLLDNYEWISGYDEHFGLHTVDRNTFERKAKPSAHEYAAIVKRNRV